MESLASVLVDSQVDLNPHQVEAALFASRNPLSRGVILADEVRLGKTIEAGLVISQHWAEQRRKMLAIVSANLRKQWHQELQDKFNLQGLPLEAKNYNAMRKEGVKQPFQHAGGLSTCPPAATRFVFQPIWMNCAPPWQTVEIRGSKRLFCGSMNRDNCAQTNFPRI